MGRSHALADERDEAVLPGSQSCCYAVKYNGAGFEKGGYHPVIESCVFLLSMSSLSPFQEHTSGVIDAKLHDLHSFEFHER